MTEEEWNKFINEQDHQLLIKNTLTEHTKLIEYIHCLFPMTGIVDKMLCNGFMMESVELLKHGIFLYEDGYFDCAFYSVRQSIENMNNMLFLSEDEAELAKWKAKERFPTDKQIKSKLQEINMAYSEIKATIPEIFDTYDELLKKANKYIHKQGFDTFYLPYQKEKLIPIRTKLFVELLKQSIGILLIMNIVLDPLSLALSDPDVDAHIYFDPMTENIPTSIFDELFDADVISKIKQTEFYIGFTKFFLEKEKLNDATYAVVRLQYFNVDALDDIEKQVHLLDIKQSLCLFLLKSGVRVSHFYFQYDFLGYSTSIEPAHHLSEYNSNQFDVFTIGDGEKNIAWNKMYISVYKVLNSYIILQHNDRFDDYTLTTIKVIIDSINQCNC